MSGMLSTTAEATPNEIFAAVGPHVPYVAWTAASRNPNASDGRHTASHRVAGALLLTRFLTTPLFGVTTTDTATLTGAVGLLPAAALPATYLLVRRAVQIDPITAAREQ